ncbi:MAG: DUF4242 domain-containing protein [Gammaproteobacteria bacterium]|nr:DUF4242 domain-containing protein [Gammaproteobacteria bacterium]
MLTRNSQWEHYYVTGDKVFCIYLADSEVLIQEHAKESGSPANTITRVARAIDPSLPKAFGRQPRQLSCICC